jgi:hypothetical protein
MIERRYSAQIELCQSLEYVQKYRLFQTGHCNTEYVPFVFRRSSPCTQTRSGEVSGARPPRPLSHQASSAQSLRYLFDDSHRTCSMNPATALALFKVVQDLEGGGSERRANLRNGTVRQFQTGRNGRSRTEYLSPTAGTLSQRYLTERNGSGKEKGTGQRWEGRAACEGGWGRGSGPGFACAHTRRARARHRACPAPARPTLESSLQPFKPDRERLQVASDPSAWLYVPLCRPHARSR